MFFWLITIAIAFCVTAILVAATRMDTGDSDIRDEIDSDIAVYKDQLIEVDRDVARGVLSDKEAEQVRLEVSRRLLDADKRQKGQATQSDSPGLTVFIVPVIILLGGGGIYLGVGAPEYSDLPIKRPTGRIGKFALQPGEPG